MNKNNFVAYKNYIDKVKDDITIGKTHRFLAKSNKMRPFIAAWRDELILQQINKRSFKKGTILLVKQKSSNYLVYRLVGVDGDELKLRGDAHRRLISTCRSSDVVAEVVAVVRKGKTINRKSIPWFYYYYLSRILQVFSFS